MIITASINPQEPEALKNYIEKSSPLFKAAGGQTISKYTISNSLVGTTQLNLVKIMEFPSRLALESVFEGQEYQKLLAFRDKAFLTLNIYLS